jgi:hypothetical protein
MGSQPGEKAALGDFSEYNRLVHLAAMGAAGTVHIGVVGVHGTTVFAPEDGVL